MDDLVSELNDIQKTVFDNFRYKTDIENYGIVEKWVMPTERYSGTEKIIGDCEDFALACRKLCRERGIQSRLIFCVVHGEGHCVLEVNGWIFDCNYRKIQDRFDLEDKGYKWKWISGYEPEDPWREIIK